MAQPTQIQSYTNRTQQGYSLVEMLVAIMLITIYVALFLQIYITNERQRNMTQQRNSASLIAYSNLRKITNRAQIPSGAPFACNTATDSTATNLTVKSDAIGADLIAGGIVPPETVPASLKNVSQYLYVTYPQGCAADLPARIVSKITYGNPTQEISHATYVR